MAKKKTITVQGTEISIVKIKEKDYFSLTDMAGANDDRPTRPNNTKLDA